MSVFTIEKDSYNITAHVSAEAASAVENALTFASDAELAEVVSEWPASRLVEIWNALPGVTPVNKFTNRETAMRRIWAAIQNLREPVEGDADVAETTPDVAPVEAGIGEGTTPPEEAAPAPQEANVVPVEGETGEEAAPQEEAEIAPKEAKARKENKTETVLALLRREGGVTAEQLMLATNWQAHSVRGFLSGTIRKKLGLPLVSTKKEDGTRSYSLPA